MTIKKWHPMLKKIRKLKCCQSIFDNAHYCPQLISTDELLITKCDILPQKWKNLSQELYNCKIKTFTNRFSSSIKVLCCYVGLMIIQWCTVFLLSWLFTLICFFAVVYETFVRYILLERYLCHVIDISSWFLWNKEWTVMCFNHFQM